MAEYDLTKTIIPYLDRHFAFPLLAHLVETETFPVEEVQAAQYELAKGTNMVDYAVNLYEQLQPDKDIPEGTLLANHVRHLPSLGRAVLCTVDMLLYGAIVSMHIGLRATSFVGPVQRNADPKVGCVQGARKPYLSTRVQLDEASDILFVFYSR